MARIHPNSTSTESSPPSPEYFNTSREQSLTVWRKSLLFNCKGFTVFDSSGNLKFRVDSYSTASKRHILLMDAAGTPLFTLRKKMLSVGDQWMIYEGEETSAGPRFSASKHVGVRHSKGVGHVTSLSGTRCRYEMEGSYSQKSVVVYDERRRAVAEVRRKEAVRPGVTLGGDVFRLVVRFGFDEALAMAFVLLLDQMFG